MRNLKLSPHRNPNKVRQTYEEFVRLGKLSLIRKLKIEINIAAREEILRHKGKISEAKCFLSQREIAYLFNSRLVSKIAFAYKWNVTCKLSIPLEWLKQVEQISELNHLIKRNSLGERFFRFLLVLRAIIKVVKYLVMYVYNLTKKSVRKTAQVYVIGHTGNLFQVADNKLFDFSNWLSSKTGKNRDVHFMLEEEFIQQIIYRSHPSFLAKSLFLTVRESIYLTRNGINLVDSLSMLDQIFSRIICSRRYLKDVAIFFTESSGGIRPYWTYGLEQQGTEVGLVNFSNSGIPSLSDGVEQYDSSIILQNWTNVYCCTERQFELISKYSFPDVNYNLKCIGVPWFRDELTNQIPIENNYIAVFDFETHKNHFGITTLNDLGYGRESMTEEFLIPILETAQKLGLTVVHKPKRKKNQTMNEQTSKLMEKLNQYSNYVRLDPRVSPVKVIMGAMCVVSMPPTTTALIARELEIPSVYFDSFGQMLSGDSALENIDLISSQIELNKWLGVNSKI